MGSSPFRPTTPGTLTSLRCPSIQTRTISSPLSEPALRCIPIFPGLVRYDEVFDAAINHAIRVTVPVTREAFTPPASHWASSETSQNAPPMGMRMRLKAGFDISSFPPNDQVILTALKQYGLIVADNGGAMFISGTPDERWNNSERDQLKTLTTSA